MEEIGVHLYNFVTKSNVTYNTFRWFLSKFCTSSGYCCKHYINGLYLDLVQSKNTRKAAHKLYWICVSSARQIGSQAVKSHVKAIYCGLPGQV